MLKTRELMDLIEQKDIMKIKKLTEEILTEKSKELIKEETAEIADAAEIIEPEEGE